MTRTITRLFDDPADAHKAVAALENNGFTSDEVSLVSRYRPDGTLVEDDETSGAASGATLGGIAGGGAGLLAALGLIAIPGIGPLVAAGVLATTLAGAAAGGVAGGLIGALTDYGVSEDDANVYAEGVRRGGSLVTVRTADDRAAEADRILSAFSTVDIDRRRQYYSSAGWQGYDPSHPPYTADEVRRDQQNRMR